MRGAARDIGARPVSVGLRAALPPSPALAAALAGTIELHLYDGGYAGLLLQEDGAANLCLSVARERMTGGPEALLADLVRESPLLGERLDASPPGQWEAIAGVPYLLKPNLDVDWGLGSVRSNSIGLRDMRDILAAAGHPIPGWPRRRWSA